MTYFISGICFLINIIKKNKIISFCCLGIFMWVLAGWCYNNADTSVYETRYLQPIAGKTEYLFDLIIYICKRIGLSFSQYRIILTGVFFVILFALMYVNSENYNIVIALYFIFPFLFDAVQLRQFCSNTIVLLAFVYLYKHGKRGIPIYMFLCLVGGLLHVSVLTYMFFAVVILIEKFWVLSVVSLTTSVIIYSVYSDNVIRWIFEMFNVSKKIDYTIRFMMTAGNSQKIHYLVFFAIAWVGFVVLLQYEKKILLKCEKKNNIIDFVIKCHITSVIFIPFIMKGTVDFCRLQYPLMILSYIAFSEVNIVKDKNGLKDKIILKKNNVIFMLACVFLSCFIEYLWILRNNNYYTVFKSIMDNNILFR